MFFSQWARVISKCVKHRKSNLISWNGHRFWNVCSDALSIITIIQQMRYVFLKEKYRASNHSFPLEVRIHRSLRAIEEMWGYPLFSSFLFCSIRSCCSSQALRLEFSRGLCDHKGWDGEGDGREVQKGGAICVPMADSCWRLTENGKIL